MRVALLVVDDGLYTHRWVAELLGAQRHEVAAAALLDPFSAPGFNPRPGRLGAAVSRIAYYGPGSAVRFALRLSGERLRGAAFRVFGRGRPGSVRGLLRRAGVPLLRVPGGDVNSPEFLRALGAFGAEAIVGAFSQRAGRALLSAAPRGCLNVHFSLLPENAGREPLFWSLLRGRGAGVSVCRMSEALDSGELLAQEPLDLAGVRSLDAAIRLAASKVPGVVLHALARLEAPGPVGPVIAPDRLNPWPSRDDVRAFRAAGFRFA